jgi:glycerol-3-phosphate dehydrogenase
MQVDTLIFGGGAAGLWLLDELLRRGQSAVLLEAGRLGQGQTVASQGIIHGGLKYTLQGLLTRSATGIREMPELWRDCLAGNRQPDLQATRLRSVCCHLWRTDSVRSRLGMIGARIGLRIAPNELSIEQRPEVLRRCPGVVARLDEQVISPADFLADLSDRNRDFILQIDAIGGLAFDCDAPGQIRAVTLNNPIDGGRLQFQPSQIVFTAGGGNAQLRRQVGLNTAVMQRRPLHMVMLRGALPLLNGHCIDGARTRVTVTSDTDSAGRAIWQVGGQIAEDGVTMQPQELIAHAADELRAVLPGIDLADVEFATYRVDRAEGSTRNGRRPEQVQILTAGNTITAWPTKLALVPQLVDEISPLLVTAKSERPALPIEWPRPRVAVPPWETCAVWQRFDARTNEARRAA